MIKNDSNIYMNGAQEEKAWKEGWVSIQLEWYDSTPNNKFIADKTKIVTEIMKRRKQRIISTQSENKNS